MFRHTNPPIHPHTHQKNTHPWVGNSPQIPNLQTESKYLDSFKSYCIFTNLGGGVGWVGGWGWVGGGVGLGGGWGWVGGGVGLGGGWGWVGAPPTHVRMCMHMHTHMHAC